MAEKPSEARVRGRMTVAPDTEAEGRPLITADCTQGGCGIVTRT